MATSAAPSIWRCSGCDGLALLGSFVAGPRALAHFADGAPLNTDDRPVVAYGAPLITHAPETPPRDRLTALLRELDPSPDELLVAASADEPWRRHLAAYWTARRRFIEAGRDVTPTADPQRMLGQVREPLLAVLRISPHFRPAYDPLLAMASAFAARDPVGARTLLLALDRVQPARPEARAALESLADSTPR